MVFRTSDDQLAIGELPLLAHSRQSKIAIIMIFKWQVEVLQIGYKLKKSSQLLLMCINVGNICTISRQDNNLI